MSLQLILGSSGAGKSHYLYTHIIEESMKNPDRNYIVVVPEQYTMAIQKRLVSMHPRKGILNIDVVSFERLAYKVFEEVGEDNLEVLDDTGKNLIIKRVLEQNKDRLKYFGSNLSNTGFVSEMKSVISEMLQYDIKPDVMQDAAGAAYSESEGSAALQYKLDDIVLVYNAFAEYIDKNYITKEEILDKLCNKVTESERIKNCEIVFDGFTGFTPVQYNLLTILLSMCPKIYVSLTIDASERENSVRGREELFFMSKDCVSKLYKICDEEHVKVLEPVYIAGREVPGKNVIVNVNSRFKNSEELDFLEQNLFRNNSERFNKKTDNIVIYEGAVAKEELTFAAGEIIRLTRLCGYRYNEIAIVTADMDGYGKLAANILKQNDIPYFLDYKRHVTDNPFIAAINGALGIIENNYSYDSVLGFLRTGMSGIEREDIDLLDNYCVAVGIRGRAKWHEPWIRKFRGTVNNTDLEKLNSLRTMITDMLDPLEEVIKSKESDVADMVKALYEFLVREDMEKKVSVLNDSEYTGDEYTQLYKKVIEVLDKMYALLGSEKVGIKEFNFKGDKNMSENAYKQAGVDVEAGYESVRLIKDDVKKTAIEGVLGGIGGFGGLFEMPKNYENPVLVSGTDGVGTKIRVAFLMDKHDTIGQDCVAMCVNDIACSGAKPLFFLDYIAIGKNVPEKVAQIVKGVADGCVLSGCALVGGETAEHPGMMPEDEYDVAGFSVGVVEKSKITDGKNAKAGNVLIGIASSGVHSNGYSLVRKVFGLNDDNAKETLNTYSDELGKTIGEELLTPTRIYVKPLLKLIDEVGINTVSHITGGGFIENVPRMLPDGLKAVIKKGSWEVLPIFNLMQKKADIPERDMYNTFNMGIGMIVAVDADKAEKAVKCLEDAGEKAYIIGELVDGEKGVEIVGNNEVIS